MRGIMVHSLMARGVPFDAAYETAERVRQKVRDRGTVTAAELAKLVSEMIGEDSGGPSFAPAPPPAISVERESGRGEPFSKGVLAQSLLAASLDATDAFQAAVEIESEIRRQRRTDIKRRELRKLVFETLLSRFGEKTAERYLIWRRYQEPDRPVIILLGGTTGAGKTSVALEVARRLGIRRVMSTDSIRQVMRLTLSRDLMPAIHASSFEAHLGMNLPEDVEEPVIEGFLAQAAIVTVGVRALVERAIKENTSLVLDGVALVPGLIDLEAYAEEAHVIPLVIANLDEEAFAGRFEARGDRQALRQTHRYLEHLEAILRIQNHFLELADRHGVPIVDNVAVESSVQLIIRHVSETLRKKAEYSLEELL
ncbi:MAG: ATP cone domain-containing protein [Myxococcota bacterium]